MAESLTEYETRFIVHWGEMGNKWGVNRTVAQIHALLFIRAEALTAEEICEYLNIARSNASNSIKELEHLKLIKRQHKLNDRREFFETSHDIWELFRIIVKERIESELKPTVEMLEEMLKEPGFKKENKVFQKRTKDTAELVGSIVNVGNEFIGLSNSMIKRLLKIGVSVIKFIPKDNQNTDSEVD